MNSSPRPRAAIAAATLLMAMATGGWLLGRSGATTPSGGAGAHLFEDVMRRVQRNFVDSISTPELLNKALIGLLAELGDPNTAYLDSARLARLTETTTGIYTGLGVRFDARDGWPMVLSATAGSPAERVGLVSGDRLTSIDGRVTRGWTDEETRAALRGDVGTTVSIEVERPGQPLRFTVRPVRGEIHRLAVRRATMLANGVGYVGLSVFSDSTERELVRAVDSLQREGMKSLVMDLRNNPGGLLAQGVAVSELFLDPGQVIVTTRGRSASDTRTYRDSTPQRWPSVTIAILVDQATASSAEIVAGALQDHDRALIMGQVTFGKGSAQSVFATTSGGLKLTTARWYTPSGRSIDRAGVPDGAADDETRLRFQTDGGRVVLGGGGVTPDVLQRDIPPLPGELALQATLGARVTEFRDVLTTYAASSRVRALVRAPDAEVSDETMAGAREAVRARGFAIDRDTWDGASRLVADFLGREMVRVALGQSAAATRTIAADALIQGAAQRLRASRGMAEVLSTVAPAEVRAARP